MRQRRRRYHLVLWLQVSIVLLIFTSCGEVPLPNKGERSVVFATPSAVSSAVAIPVCHQALCLMPKTVPGVRQFVDTWKDVHILLPFTYNMQDAASVAKYYDFIWGASLTTVPSLRAGNPNIFLSYYIPMNRDGGDFGNSAVGKTRGLSYWQTLHPDWVLYKCDRTTPAYEIHDPNIPLNMTDENFINWQVQTYATPASQQGFDAIAADNLNLDNAFGACGYYNHGKWVQRYTGQSDDPQWRKDMLFWVTEMQKKLHALPHPMALIANLGYYGSNTISNPAGYQLVQQIVQHVDGVLDESGFTHYGVGYLTDQAWINTVRLIQYVQAQQRPYYIIDEFPADPVSRDDAEWALSSYLMGKEHLSALFYSGPQQYGQDLRYPEYDIPIGMPTNEMYMQQNVYWRNYSGGLVIVNPSSLQTFTITLGQNNYTDLDKHAVGQTLTMKPHSGVVLLKK